MSPPPALSIVVPVYNEAAILVELAERCLATAASTQQSHELILVDDGSTDETRNLHTKLPPGVRVLHLAENCGQLNATRIGIHAAQGALVCVLDGDLQDPPEVLEQLFQSFNEDLDVVFAVKVKREDPIIFRILRSLYGTVMHMAPYAPPPGSGAYCMMRQPLARRVAQATWTAGNLSVWIMREHPRFATVPYRKKARYDHDSHVGWAGLVREAFGSAVVAELFGLHRLIRWFTSAFPATPPLSSLPDVEEHIT